MPLFTPELMERARLRPGKTIASADVPAWKLSSLRGRLVELTASHLGASCGLSATAALLYEAQAQQEPAVWISARESTFFPPDLAAYGIDLGALPVVMVGTEREAAWAADELLRSGGVGLVVLDLGSHTRVPQALLTRLGGLAQRHHAGVVCLTCKGPRIPLLGSLVSLRGEGHLERRSFDEFSWSLAVVKDKRGGPGWSHREVCHGSDGMC